MTGTATVFSPDTATEVRPRLTLVTVSFGSGVVTVSGAADAAGATTAVTSSETVAASAAHPLTLNDAAPISAGWHGRDVAA
ncbi:hypothetical protein GCM10009789_16090 [Kribbella sancticallisti]|uniref:Uncharacterized protein n=1 Tax=Kribbella sancticallisti TaxID=460087 RepID=A0ABN2CSV5_9ACTN